MLVFIIFTYNLKKKKTRSDNVTNIARDRTESERHFKITPKIVEDETINANEIVIGTSENRPYASLTIVPTDYKPKNSTPIQTSSKAWEKLAPVIQMAPSVLTSAEMSGSTYMKVVVNGSLARAADGDGYRGFVKDASTGKIVRHGRLHDAKALKDMITLTAGFQVLSVIVGQEQLAAINKKLSEIQDDVKSIQFMLRNQRSSKIMAIFKHLSNYNIAITSGDITEAYRVNIEHTELELKSFSIELENEIINKTNELKNYEDKENFGSSDMHKYLTEKFSDLDDLVRLLFICIECRIMACQLISFFPNSKTISELRLSDINSDIQRITNRKGVIDAASDAFLSRIGDIRSSFNFNSTIKKRKNELNSKHDEMKANILKYEKEVTLDVSNSDNLLRKINNPLEMLVKVDKGNIQEAMIISES